MFGIPYDLVQAACLQRLRTIVRPGVQVALPEVSDILFCDRSTDCSCVPWIGFRTALERLQNAHYRGRPFRPVLIVGLHATAEIRSYRGTEVLAHPSVAYLGYDDALSPQADSEAVLAAIRGWSRCGETLPASLVPDVAGLLKRVAEVRHLFKGRSIPIGVRHLQLVKAAQGGPFPTGDAVVPPAFSKPQEDMLESLWACSDCASTFAPSCGGLTRVEAAVRDFVAAWDEYTRGIGEIPAGGASATAKAVLASKAVAAAIDTVVECCNALEKEVSQPI
jgi:hypothetical protein